MDVDCITDFQRSRHLRGNTQSTVISDQDMNSSTPEEDDDELSVPSASEEWLDGPSLAVIAVVTMIGLLIVAVLVGWFGGG